MEMDLIFHRKVRPQVEDLWNGWNYGVAMFPDYKTIRHAIHELDSWKRTLLVPQIASFLPGTQLTSTTSPAGLGWHRWGICGLPTLGAPEVPFLHDVLFDPDMFDIIPLFSGKIPFYWNSTACFYWNSTSMLMAKNIFLHYVYTYILLCIYIYIHYISTYVVVTYGKITKCRTFPSFSLTRHIVFR